MSEIKVDVVSPYTGTSMTVGESGDTVTCSGTAVGFGGGKILQCISVTKVDIFSTTTTASYTDVTGLTKTITPSASTSKILVIFNICLAALANNRLFCNLYQESSQIHAGTATGSRPSMTAQQHAGHDAWTNWFSGSYLTAAIGSTSNQTFKFAIKPEASSGGFVNRSYSDSDGASQGRFASTITLMEIGA